MRRFFFIVFLIGSLLIAGCNPQKRLHRLLKNYPELNIKDSLTIYDTIYTQGSRIDTAFVFDSLKVFDTIILHKDKLTVKLIKTKDTVFLSGECKGDTIYIEKKIYIDKIKYEKPNIWSKNIVYITIISCIAGLILIIILLKSIFK